MKIGFMCHDSWGGSSRIAIDLAESLALRGHEVHLFTISPPSMLHGGEETSIALHSLYAAFPSRRNPGELYWEWTKDERAAFTNMVCRTVAKEKLEILHYHYALPFARIAADVKLRMTAPDIKTIGTLHGTDVTSPLGKKDSLFSLTKALKDADFLTTVSYHHARLSKTVFLLKGPPVVIPNFADPRFFGTPSSLKPATKSRYCEKRRIIHISNFRPVKGPNMAIEIFSGIVEKVDAQLWLVGDGPLKDETIAALRKKRLTGHVRVFPAQRDVSAFIAEADLLLVSSVMESFCLVALEAMMCGTPVLAPEIGGIPELIEDGRTGFLYPPGDTKSAVEKSVRLLSDEVLWLDVASNSIRKASGFSRERISGLYEKIYTEALCRNLYSLQVDSLMANEARLNLPL